MSPSPRDKSTEPNGQAPEVKAAWITAVAAVLAAIIGGAAVFWFGRIFNDPSSPTPIVITEIVLQTVPVEASTSTDKQTPEVTVIPNTTPTSDIPDVPMIKIPAGKFTMGRPILSAKDERPNEGPAHTVSLEEFYIDKYEITNGDYKACVDAGVCNLPHSLNSSARTKGYYSNPDYANFPVVHVDWYMAEAYCEWRGTRLPTEAEWEKAARGTNDKHFPWGQNIVSCAFTQYATCGKDTVAVGRHPDGVSPYGVHDMAGNVWEWVADWYGSDYYALSPPDNPKGPASGVYRVARGGGWNSNSTQLWVTYRTRFTPDSNTFNLGFRCAKNP